MHTIARIMAIVCMAVFSLQGFADTEALWWMVGEPEKSYGNLSGITIRDLDGTVIPAESDGSMIVRGLEVTEARVRVVETGEYLPIVDIDVPVDDPPTSGDVPDYFFSVVSGDMTTYSFMIELGNYDFDNGTWTTLAVSDEVRSYTDLKNADYIHKWSDTPDPTSGLYWAPTSYTVPEPSGGLLLLIGGGLLALRRRRKGGI